jgi:hypothetical protein
VFHDLVPLLIALGAATAIYVLRELRRRRLRIRPPMPTLTMHEAWDIWERGSQNKIDAAFVPVQAKPDSIPDRVRAAALANVLETERVCAKAENPRVALRRAILDSAAIALHIEAISQFGEQERKALLKGYTEGMDELLVDALAISTLKWIVLREYARLKYDDAAEADGFHYFMQVAKPYIRERVRLARDHVLELNEGSRRFAEIYDALLSELRQQMLKARPKRQFVPPDLP